MLRAYLLGGLALTWNDDPVRPIPGTAARSLFAYLLTHRHLPHTRNLLAGTFWPDLPEATARRRLSRALWQIRNALRPPSGQSARQQGRAQGSAEALVRVQGPAALEILTAEGDTIQVAPDLGLWLDIEEFNRDSAACIDGEEGSIRAGERCLALYRGEFLSGYYDDWVLVERERLRGVLLEVLERLLRNYKVRAEYERALAAARRLVTEDPWRETVHREVMRLLHLLGRDPEALQQFDVCRQVLAEDLGMEPSPETTALATEIGSQVELAERPVLPEAAQPVGAPLLAQPDRLPLVGRRQELAELLRQLEAAAAGTGGLAIVYGEAGVGKSRLLRELAANAEWRGMPAAWGRCYTLTAPLAYQPLVEVLSARLPALRESTLEPLWRAVISGLLPELAPEEGMFPPLAPEQEQRRLLEAFTQGLLSLADLAPHLVLVEDAHWLDPASLGVLRYLLPNLSQASVLVVLAVRSEELAQPVADGLAGLEGTHWVRRLVLQRFDQEETEELIQRALGLERPPSLFCARLHAETDGNPFFLIETLRMLVDDGLLFRDGAGAWSTPWDDSTRDYAELPLPASVVQSIERRFDHLAEPLNQVMSLAATIGGDVGFGLWQAASGWDEETLLAAGDALCARGLMLAVGAEHVGADYVFSHDLIRRLAYERLAPPRRRLYHRRVAEALMELAPDQLGPLAHHWTEAQEWDRAADSHHLAGDQARAVHANAEAVAHYTQALACLEQASVPAAAQRRFELHLAREAVWHRLGEREAQAEELRVLRALADSLGGERRRAEVAQRQTYYAETTGDYVGAIEAAQQTLGWAEAIHDVHLQATAHWQWGRALWRQGNFGAARSQIETARALAHSASLPQAEADSLRDLGAIAFQQGNHEDARASYEQALQICRSAGDQQGEGRALVGLGVVSSLQGDNAQAMIYYEHGLRISHAIGDRQNEGNGLNNLGIVCKWLGRYAESEAHFERSLLLSRQIGDRGSESATLNNLGDVCRRQGKHAEARSYLRQALSIKREIGERPGEALTLNALGHVSRDMGDYEGARTYYEKARSIFGDINDSSDEASSLACLGLVSLALGDYAQAQSFLEQALSIVRDGGYPLVECECLSGLGLCAHHLGDNQAAQAICQQALRLAQDLGERSVQARNLNNLGHIQGALGQFAAATQAYQQALGLRRELGECVLATEPLAGLASVALAQGDLPSARRPVEEILEDLEAGTLTYSLEGTEEPFRVYLTCHRVLQALQDPRAAEVLSRAHELLQERATQIAEERTRRSFLQNVAANRHIVAAYEELEASRENALADPEPWRKITVSLPLADAPLGRPLREDEYVTVTWTVAAPEDTGGRKVARRRRRIVRLLREAQAQGAVPSYSHLAEALGVSLRTIERDMAALSWEHPDLPPTRGKMSA